MGACIFRGFFLVILRTQITSVLAILNEVVSLALVVVFFLESRMAGHFSMDMYIYGIGLGIDA